MRTTTREHHTRDTGQTPRWDRLQIRAARMVAIPPFLEKRGFCLLEYAAGNYHVRELPGLIVKDSFWRWPERGLSGNTIDLCMLVLHMRFNDAMLALSQTVDDSEGGAHPEAS
jgi:hypothetical protein